MLWKRLMTSLSIFSSCDNFLFFVFFALNLRTMHKTIISYINFNPWEYKNNKFENGFIEWKLSMIHFFPFCSGWVLWQKWWNHVLLSVKSTSEQAVSFIINFDCFLVDWSWGFGSWQKSVQDFHTCADLVVQDFESFFLACLFLNVKGTEVEPKPCWSSQECKSGLIISWFT